MHELSRPLRALAALIAGLAGYVDAIGFAGFGGAFVSFMSGNSTRVGVGTVSPLLAPAAFTALVIVAFVLGVAAGQALGGSRAAPRRWRVSLLVAASLAFAAIAPTLFVDRATLLAAAF